MASLAVIDPEHVVNNPDLGAGVMFGVYREDAPGPDDQMVDILGSCTDRNRVPDEPLRAQFREHPPDLDLAERTLVPGPRIVMKNDALRSPQRGISGLRLGLNLKTPQRNGITCLAR